jgi:UDP-2,3-diacylglucosamine pyrophosphatase LpxH
MNKKIFKRLAVFYSQIPVLRVSRKDKIVIFSDLHMGDGGRHDDFLKNSSLFRYVLENYYDRRKYKLLLNGDVEELQRFPDKKIYRQWESIYAVFSRFRKRNDLLKIIGNHDYELGYKESLSGIPVSQGLRLQLNKNEMVVFHGFQANRYPKIYYVLSTLILRLLANPLGIKNYSVAYNSRKRYTVEKRVYQFAKREKVIAIIGHTHRPLFESLSRVDTLKFNIERLCRLYPESRTSQKKKLEEKLAIWKNELSAILAKDSRYIHRDLIYLYDSEPLVPCIFNSGCVIGRRGITAIEIAGNQIRLVYWFDRTVSQKIFDTHDRSPQKLDDTDFYRLVLKKEDLDYIFTRVKLLS